METIKTPIRNLTFLKFYIPTKKRSNVHIFMQIVAMIPCIFDIFEKSQFNGFVSKKIIVHLQTDNKNQTI
jgi:hypothetical protein